MSMAGAGPEEGDLLAAELALGLLDDAERHHVETRGEYEPELAMAVERWREHAAALVTGPDVSPRPSVWARIEKGLPTNDVAPDPGAAVRRWQLGTLVASAAAIALAMVAVNRSSMPSTRVINVAPQQAVAPQPIAPLVAVLTEKAGRGVMTVSFDPAGGHIVTVPRGVATGRRDAELWVTATDGKPHSLGVVSGDRATWAKVPDAVASEIIPGAALAVSLEPVGGSPTGQPTGAMILTGKMATT